MELMQNPVFLLLLVILLGDAIGRLRVLNFQFGTSAIVFVGLAFGHFGFVLPNEFQTFGLVLFIYSVGLQAGPGFIASFKSHGLKETLGAGIGHALNDSPIQEALAHYRMRESFHAAAVKWASMGEKLPDSEEARLKQFDALVGGGAPQQVAESAAAKQKSQEEKKAPEEKKEEAKEAQEPEAEIGPEDTPLHIVDDQPAEERRVIDQEAIEFHSANVAIIQRNMDKDIEEIARETNPDRRHDLEMRVLNAKANLQSEQDRIETLKTGVIVHTRSAWDDFARSQFIQNIAEDQRKMEKVDRAMKKALSMADSLPYDKAEKVRAIVAKGFSPEVMTATDTAKASEVIKEVYGVATGHWEGEKKKADADAEWADTCLQTAETTKSYA
ncbi:MAG: hypothetical protein CVU63_17845, partial [Deltaproteobacteria bacterium HGW-Deltaproteobacteria-20]